VKKILPVILVLLMLTITGCGLFSESDENSAAQFVSSDPPLITKHPAIPEYEKFYKDPFAVIQKNTYDDGVNLRGFNANKVGFPTALNVLLQSEFDTRTVWPKTLPAGYEPDKIMAIGKNPGLGVVALHKQGITGKGVSVAIIDQPLYIEHTEYKNQIKSYEELPERGGESQASMHASSVTSILVGKTDGVAPAADVYFIAAELAVSGTPAGESPKITYIYYAAAIERVIKISAQLPDENKIRVISISRGFDKDDTGYKEICSAIQHAKQAGIFIVCTGMTGYYDGFEIWGLGRSNPYSDPDRLSSYTIANWEKASLVEDYAHYVNNKSLWVPMCERTLACERGQDDYTWFADSGKSWAIPWLAGMYALCCQVKPSITPDEFLQKTLASGNEIQAVVDGKQQLIKKVINPAALIEALRK